jgi:hypothetical protein
MGRCRRGKDRLSDHTSSPLESQSNKWAEKDSILCAMDKDLQREKLKLLLISVPGVSGVNINRVPRERKNRVL